MATMVDGYIIGRFQFLHMWQLLTKWKLYFTLLHVVFFTKCTHLQCFNPGKLLNLGITEDVTLLLAVAIVFFTVTFLLCPFVQCFPLCHH